MTTTQVKTYRSARRFRRDARRMARKGYQVVSSFQEPGKNKPLRNLLKFIIFGWWATLIFGASIKGGKVVVTYQALGATVMVTAGAQPAAVGALLGQAAPVARVASVSPRSVNLLAVAMIAVLVLAVLIVAAQAL